MTSPGRLIIVEGTDGSGKSTQIQLLKRWLESQDYPVVYTEWNSSKLVKSWTKKAKQNKQLTPTTFSLIHASDFFDRYERHIEPLLQAGFIVLADRYIYTAYARDVARGCSPEWVRNTYMNIMRPSLALYFQTPTDIAVERILSGRQELKYHEAGLDLGLSKDPAESFTLFQGLIKDAYDSMVETDQLTVIDGTLPIEQQQIEVRRLVTDILAEYERPAQIPAFTDPLRLPALHKQRPPGDVAAKPLHLSPNPYPGKLIVIEGSDYSGHSKQSGLLRRWLEEKGYAVYETGIKRSRLMRQAIEEAKQEPVVGSRTMGIFYATDFADQLETGIMPALRAGYVVIADRYMYTLMARQLVRNADEQWLDALYSFALQPDWVFYLSVPTDELVKRCFQTYGELFFWEAGMDLAISSNPLNSVLQYQDGLRTQYEYLADRCNFETLDGTQPVDDIQDKIRRRMKGILMS